MHRGCPKLYTRHVAARSSPATVPSSDDRVLFAALKAPWTSAVHLKRHLLLDPTSKSRDKFVGIIESLFNHPRFSLSDANLATTFERLVLKVAFVFKNDLLGAVPITSAVRSSVDSSSDHSSSVRGPKAHRKKRHFSSRTREEEDDDVSEDETSSVKASLVDSVEAEEPPKKMRYLTRSSADNVRTSFTLTQGTSFRCGMDRRAVRQHMPLIRPDMHPVADNHRSVESPVAHPAQVQEGAAHVPECVFDATLFDDHHIGTDLDCEQWDFLDDWAWQHNAGPTVLTYTTLNSPRPSHPLPLQGAGFTLHGQPMANVNQHTLASFRSIAHTTVPSFDEFDHALSSPSPILWAERHDTHTHESSLSSPSHAPRASILPSVPFPDNNSSSMYARRTAFYRPVTPEPPFRQLASSGQIVRGAAEATAPLTESTHSATSDNASWSDSEALSSCMTLDSQYVSAMGQLGVQDPCCERSQSAAPSSFSSAEIMVESDRLW